MSLKTLLSGELTVVGLRIRSVLLHRSYASVTESAKQETIDLTSVDTDPKFEDELVSKPYEIEAMRNKSRLNEAHRNVLHGRRPYNGEGFTPFHNTKKFKRQMLGRYGIEGSGVEPGLAWPNEKDIAEMQEYERVAYPLSLTEAWEKLEEQKRAAAERLRVREETLAKNLASTKQWARELKFKLAKKEADILASKERKERLVEEVRRHFGFKVDPRDEKFKEMLEQKEKEDKKRKKEEKKKERAEKLLARLMEGTPPKEGSPTPPKNDKSKPDKPADLA